MSACTKLTANLSRYLIPANRQRLSRYSSQVSVISAPEKMDEITRKFKLPKAYEGSEPSVW